MSSNSHQEIEVLQDRLEESQRQLTRAQEDNEKKEKTLRGWTILAKTARKRIEVLEKQSRDCDNWKATAHRHKHELEALKLRTTREANKRERDLAQVEQGLRETIEQELRERIEQESRAAVMEERKCQTRYTEHGLSCGYLAFYTDTAHRQGKLCVPQEKAEGHPESGQRGTKGKESPCSNPCQHQEEENLPVQVQEMKK